MPGDFGYLEVGCGPYRILMPAENVGGVDPDFAGRVARLSPRYARRSAWPLVIDARTLLGLGAGSAEPGVNVYWRRTDDTVRAILVVDRVDSLRSGVDGDFLPPPLVPRAFHDMFDLLLVEKDGHFLMRLRQDICLRLDDRASQRRFCRAILGALPPEHWQATKATA